MWDRDPARLNFADNQATFFFVHSELILALKKVLSYRKLGKETLLSTALVLLYSILSDHTATQPSHIWLNVLIELYVCALQNDPKQFSSMPSCTVPSFMLMNVSRFAFLSYLHRNTEFSLVEQLKLQCNVVRVHC